MKEKLAFISKLVGILIFVCLSSVDNELSVNATISPAKFKKSCIKCTEYGFKFCGDYNNPYKYTKCSKSI